jgi:hypothetical protein
LVGSVLTLKEFTFAWRQLFEIIQFLIILNIRWSC